MDKTISCKSCGEVVRKADIDELLRYVKEGKMFNEKCPKCKEQFKVEPILSFKFWYEK